MFIKENIFLAIAGIRSSKMRSLLTMLGIIIGISSVIGIVSIGSAITGKVSGELDKLGANNMYIQVREKSGDNSQERYSSKEPEDSDLLTLEQINSIKEAFTDRISNISIDDKYRTRESKGWIFIC